MRPGSKPAKMTARLFYESDKRFKTALLEGASFSKLRKKRPSILFPLFPRVAVKQIKHRLLGVFPLEKDLINLPDNGER